MAAEPQNWSDVISNAKAEGRKHGESAPPAAVSRIVAAAAHQRREWIINAWKSLAFRAVAIATLAIAATALVFWLRYETAPPAPITPLPILDQFPDAEIKP